MINTLKDFLRGYRKSMISLDEIASIFPGNVEYIEFAKIIQQLTEEGVLKPVKKHGVNSGVLPLHYTYRILKGNLRKEVNEEIKKYNLQIHSEINLEPYFHLGEEQWDKDLPYILKIDSAIKERGITYFQNKSTPEVSFLLLGDEKWIEEKQGRKVLERISLLEKLQLAGKADPLMFAVDPNKLAEKEHKHLIVENKTPFYSLMEDLQQSPFTTVVYGCGWKIASNVNMLPVQLGLKDCENTYVYFGDLDLEGISIWYFLYEKYNIKLALPFYKAMLSKEYAIGKETQRKNDKAIAAFKTHFSLKEQGKVQVLLDVKGYYPQESLSQQELITIWREYRWKKEYIK